MMFLARDSTKPYQNSFLLCCWRPLWLDGLLCVLWCRLDAVWLSDLLLPDCRRNRHLGHWSVDQFVLLAFGLVNRLVLFAPSPDEIDPPVKPDHVDRIGPTFDRKVLCLAKFLEIPPEKCFRLRCLGHFAQFIITSE